MRVVLLFVMFAIVYSLELPGLRVPASLNTRVLEVDTFADFINATFYIGVFNYLIYLGVGSALE
jgi:hypothetical protein